MRLLVTAFAAIGLSGFLIGCGTTSPIGSNSTKYQADYASCDKTVSDTVTKRNAKTALVWFSSSVTRWSEIDDGVNSCMRSKGWGVARACTEEERRRGGQAGSLVVTARGISCMDPGRPS